MSIVNFRIEVYSNFSVRTELCFVVNRKYYGIIVFVFVDYSGYFGIRLVGELGVWSFVYRLDLCFFRFCYGF